MEVRRRCQPEVRAGHGFARVAERVARGHRPGNVVLARILQGQANAQLEVELHSCVDMALLHIVAVTDPGHCFLP
jgi:hypothetical protein